MSFQQVFRLAALLKKGFRKFTAV